MQTPTQPGTIKPHLELFLYLQVLDFLTTLVGLRVGVQEISPFVKQVMALQPAVGLAMSKLIAVGLAGVCLWLQRPHLIRWINYWYAGLVLWNLCIILAGLAL